MGKRLVTAVAAALALGGCSKSEQAAPRPQARIEAPQAASEAGKSQEEIDAGLKERLARQEAASKMFEKGAPEPTPAPKAPAPPKAETPKAPEPVKSAPPAAAAKPAEPPKPVEAPKAAAKEAAPEPKAAPAPAPAPTKAEPPPRAEAAPAKPAASTAARLITRVDPEFPREALQANIERGLVKVRISIDEAGAVTRVEVIEANPRRVFDRAVVRALTQWKFSEGAPGRSVETEVEFKRGDGGRP